jgi:hypothetical protein
MWPLLVWVVVSADPAACQCTKTAQPAAEATADISGSQRDAQSPNFHVLCRCGSYDARQLAQTCEQWRTHLRGKWLADDEGDAAWSPRCQVVVHADRAAYAAAVGRGAERTFGSTWIDVKQDRVAGRRVDLLIDLRRGIAALGHELTHVVLADAFGGQQPPPWANEGIALLADSADKQQRHHQDLTRAVHSGTTFTCGELMSMEDYPAPHRVGAFYAQSASLVQFLSQRGEPHEFVAFLKHSAAAGIDEALAEAYDIESAGHLHRLWAESLAAPAIETVSGGGQ